MNTVLILIFLCITILALIGSLIRLCIMRAKIKILTNELNTEKDVITPFNSSKECRFSQLSTQDIFFYMGDYYIKIENLTELQCTKCVVDNAVSLSTGQTDYFPSDVKVCFDPHWHLKVVKTYQGYSISMSKSEEEKVSVFGKQRLKECKKILSKYKYK